MIILSHHLFAEDTSIFSKANPKQFRNLWCHFLCFEAVSRLKINPTNSKLVPVGAKDDVGGLASILGCSVSSLLMKYSGLPLGALFMAKSIWNGIIEKMEHRLAS